MRYIETITSDLLPTSFVRTPLKYASDTGNGEAKLYLRCRGIASEASYINFFNGYASTNSYRFVKRNLINYMNDRRIHHEYCCNNNIYKGINLNYWNQKLREINSLDEYAYFNLEYRWVDSQERYYIRSTDYIFRDIFRSIAIPKMSYLSISKYLEESTGNYIYNFELNIHP